jgi:folate-binding protein YgfZ
MSQTYQIPDTAVSETPLAAQLSASGAPAPELTMHRGARTPLRFAGTALKLEALVHKAGVFDLGYRAFLRATNKDRVRWLNGMITQAVKFMVPGQVGYTLVLNAQGRIQGDADVLCFEDFLLLETDRAQIERLLTHLRRFIIMDDVKLEELDAPTTAIGMAGPGAGKILENLGGSLPEAERFGSTQLAGIEVRLVTEYGPIVPKFEIHLAPEQVFTVWEALLRAGASPCGVEATENLRVFGGLPQYDVDFSDKHLPQETNLTRALNFTKGCYLGQEIVERIRSRATVHRSLRQFELQGETPKPGAGEKLELRAGDAVVGELTSVARIDLPDLHKTLALGIARVEALDKVETDPIRYDGGLAVPLASLAAATDPKS